MKYVFPVSILLCLLLSSCARKMSFITSPVVPAAQGKVKIKKDGNNNYTISVDVTNLADSKDLTPPRNTYVVWMDADGSPRKLGQITTSTGLFSDTRKGSMKATSITKPDKVFITAEDDVNARYPGLQVLTTD